MNTAEQILVIFLSSALAVFLIVGITLGLMLIQVMRRIRHIAEVAEQVADNVESATETLRNASGPLAIFKVINNMRRQVNKTRGK